MTLTDEDLVAASSRQHLVSNAVPTPAQAADRESARALVRQVLGDRLRPDGLRFSPAGVAWTYQFDAYVSRSPDDDHLRSHGWLPLDHLLRRIGAPAGGHWAVVSEGRVLAGVRILTGGLVDPVVNLLARATSRREVRLLEVVELRALLRQGHSFPAASAVLRAAADIESALGGRELVRWTSGRRLSAPVTLRLRTRERRQRLVVGCSGLDGSGKTTLMDSLALNLGNAGVESSRVWLRPGMGLGTVATFAGLAKRILNLDPRPGVALLAAEPHQQLRSRRGSVGWLWSLLVTSAFVVGVRRQHALSKGVVLCDRHVSDALATLESLYAGTDLRVQRWLAKALTPAADTTFFLDVPAEVSLQRKQDDVIGAEAIRLQLDAYRRWLAELPGVHRLDGTRPATEVSAAAMSHLVAARSSDKRGWGW